jgi:hypothetical protein
LPLVLTNGRVDCPTSGFSQTLPPRLILIDQRSINETAMNFSLIFSHFWLSKYPINDGAMKISLLISLPLVSTNGQGNKKIRALAKPYRHALY